MNYADIGLAAMTDDPHAGLHLAMERAHGNRTGEYGITGGEAVYLIAFVLASAVVVAVPVSLGALAIGGVKYLGGDKEGGGKLLRQGAMLGVPTGLIIGGLGWQAARRKAALAAAAVVSKPATTPAGSQATVAP